MDVDIPTIPISHTISREPEKKQRQRDRRKIIKSLNQKNRSISFVDKLLLMKDDGT